MIKRIFLEEIMPQLIFNDELKVNLCADCYGKKVNLYSEDTGICWECGKICDVLNPFIYESLKKYRFSSLECYRNVPRKYHFKNRSDEDKAIEKWKEHKKEYKIINRRKIRTNLVLKMKPSAFRIKKRKINEK